MGEERTRREVRAAMDDLIRSGAEIGLQVAVMRHGQLVVDEVAGVADPDTGRRVEPDTLFWAGSTAKGVASSVAHVLAERGDVDYDMRAVDVWPEFAPHGKERITLRHVLLHTAGVPGLPGDTTVEHLCDWGHMCEVLAGAEPWWEPGTRFGYHAHTFGFLLGEILRRASGRPISTLLRELITGPLGIEGDVHFGVPAQHLGRVARQVPADGGPPPAPDPATPPGILHDAAYANRADVLTCDIPSEGTMTARGAARVHSALLGHVQGVPLVSAGRLAQMAAVSHTGMDEVMRVPTVWAFGYSPFRPSGTRAGSTFGMVGMNGSAAYADIDSGIVVALMRNRFTPGDFSALGRIDHIVADQLG